MDRRILAVLAAVLAAGCATPAREAAVQDTTGPGQPILVPLDVAPVPDPPAEPSSAAGPEWAPGTYLVSLQVHGEKADGLLTVPAGTPTAIAVVAHGWGGNAAAHQEDLEDLAQQGAVAVAMDFRGDRGAFKVQAGVEDTIAATRFLQESFPAIDRTLLYGWSMGGEVALLAVQQAAPGTYDYAFIGAGVADLEGFWDANPFAQAAIEAETGGRPADVPEEYARRSPVDQAPGIAAAGLARVFLVHGGGDPIVPVEQSERLYRALADAGQPVSFYVVTKDRVDGGCILPNLCHGPLLILASHEAGEYRLMRPFIEHRLQRLADPAAPAVQGTYDAATGEYDPSDVG